jgi:hypothetical protein
MISEKKREPAGTRRRRPQRAPPEGKKRGAFFLARNFAEEK